MEEQTTLVSDPTEALLGIAMPVFDEERWIDEILRRVLAQPEVAQVVAVDDGSTDGTWERLSQWPGRDARVEVLRHDTNRGKGAAVRTALERLTTPLILIQDADLEYAPGDYPRLLKPIQSDHADVVYGSRFLGGSNGNPRWHTLGNRLLTWAGNRLTGLALTDEATCYKLFKLEVLERIRLEEDGFGFCPEVTAKIARLGVRLVEVPITYHGRNASDGKKIRLRDGLGALTCLWRYRR